MRKQNKEGNFVRSFEKFRTSQFGDSMKHTGSRVLKLLLDVLNGRNRLNGLNGSMMALVLAVPG